MNPREEEHVPDGEVLATWWRQDSPGCYYWRCLVPARHLPGQALRLTFDDAVDADNDVGVSFPRQRGAAVWQFSGNSTRGILMRAMQLSGIRVLLEADDNYLVPSEVFSRDWSVKHSEAEGRHSLEAHRGIAKFVDGIIVATPHLADVYKEINPNIYVCPNSVEPNDWPEPQKPDDGVLRIGWAASHSHLFDAPLVAKALRWASRQPDVEVLVYGLGDIVDFGARVKTVPWTDDLARYRDSLGMCDVHICPLYETSWSKGKSDIKAMEAAMAGAWPIVSSATPYRPWRDRTIECSTPDHWCRALRWAVKNRDEIPKLAAEARRYVLTERRISQHIHKWREAINA